MSHLESQHGPDSPLETIATRNSEAIIGAIATEFHLKAEEIRVVPQDSFRSADGTVSFVVRGKDGVYGVNGTINDEGNIIRMTTVNLQATEYR